MIYPNFIQKGSKIGVPAPSDGAYDEVIKNRYKNAKKNLENLGFNIIESKNIYNSQKARSADAKIRAEELNQMFDDENIDFILCAAGGEFLVEILPYINFEKIVEHPKFVQGFSDPTGILFPLTTKYDIATIYSNNYKSFGVEKLDESLNNDLEILTGNIIEQKNFNKYEEERCERVTGLEGYNLTEDVVWKVLDNNSVKIKGRIIGGCFDIISELAGTKYDGMPYFNEKYKEDGIIWYFDNCELSKEELIRTLWKFNELGYFKYTRGIVFGRNGAEISNIGYTMEDALNDSVISKLNIPIIYDADISHKGPTMTIINGAVAEIEVNNGKSNIKLELKK
ncbi:MAG: LD-carboxypeptidase [Clostridia bacterium]|nr:LD-carboxypeptidase [Clostridia bacterium]